jgi:tetratricopeptide (TPR) repeat protein
MAFLPALFAVLILGLHLTFWRDAMAATVDTLDVLVFAFLIYCLLKFRISQDDKWLGVFAFVYGLGTTNNWALIAFFPLFLISLVWIKGVNFFNWRFLARIIGCGFLGLLLYLLMPAVGSLGPEKAGFLTLLHMELGAQRFGLRSIPRWVALVAALPTVLPLIFASIKWPSFEGEISAAGNALTKLMFRLLHVVFLLLALIMFFDFKFSPSLRLRDEPAGFLTFYYIGALCIGYFSGYILLVYGKNSLLVWERAGGLSKMLNRAILGLLWILAIAAPCGLLYQNLPRINAHTNKALTDFSDETMRDLPAKPAIILADDPVQLYLIEAGFQRAGKTNKNILIETGSFQHREYISYLIGRHPELKKVTNPVDKLPRVLPPQALIVFLAGVNHTYPIYYLNPSFGYYFENFYLKPHGLVYEAQFYPSNILSPPLITAQDIAENEAVWNRLTTKTLATLPAAAELDANAAALSSLLSVDLDSWGVQLQKAGHFKEANAYFTEAVRLNQQNFIAGINKDYNTQAQKGNYRPINSEDRLFKAINLYRSAAAILKYNGPPDEPGLDLDFGQLMAEGHDYRQSAILLTRRLQLLPGDPPALLDLAKTFVDWRLPDKAFDVIRQLHASPAADKWEVTRVEALAYYTKGDFATAEQLLRKALQENPSDEGRINILADFYRASAIDILRAKKPNQDEANRRFQNALAYFNQELQLAAKAGRTPDPRYTPTSILLKKAEVEIMLKSFDHGISTLNQVIAIQPDNATAILNRAIVEIQVNQMQAARDDYERLRRLMPDQPYVVDFGLAEIAAHTKDRAMEIHYLKRFLGSAPQEGPDYQQVLQRLKKLEKP